VLGDDEKDKKNDLLTSKKSKHLSALSMEGNYDKYYKGLEDEEFSGSLPFLTSFLLANGKMMRQIAVELIFYINGICLKICSVLGNH
jgi:hypothetical protein